MKPAFRKLRSDGVQEETLCHPSGKESSARPNKLNDQTQL